MFLFNETNEIKRIIKRRKNEQKSVDNLNLYTKKMASEVKRISRNIKTREKKYIMKWITSKLCTSATFQSQIKTHFIISGSVILFGFSYFLLALEKMFVFYFNIYYISLVGGNKERWSLQALQIRKTKRKKNGKNQKNK